MTGTTWLTDMDTHTIRDILSHVKFKFHPSYTIRVGEDILYATDEEAFDHVRQPWLQIVDNDLPKEYASGRKWRLSQHMTESEVVGTAWAAYKAWREHEDMESFTYCGVAVFNPHVSIQARVEMASNKENYEYRD